MNGILTLMSDNQVIAQLTQTRPKSLMRMADSTILGHLIGHASNALKGGQLTVIVPQRWESSVNHWLSAHSLEFEFHLHPVAPETSEWDALRSVKEQCGSEELLLMSDRAIVLADYQALRRQKLLLCSLNQAVFYFKSGQQLANWLDMADTDYENMADAIHVLGQDQLEVVEPFKFLPIESLPEILTANRRLLGIGHTSDSALERSYAEEFAVIPPVYIDASAEIIASVIGPYTSIGPDAIVDGSIVRHTLIEAGAEIEHALLEEAIIGQNSRVSGRYQTLIVPDHTTASVDE